MQSAYSSSFILYDAKEGKVWSSIRGNVVDLPTFTYIL